MSRCWLWVTQMGWLASRPTVFFGTAVSHSSLPPFPHLDKGDGRCLGWVGTGDQPGAWHVALAVLSSLHLLVGADPD